MSTSEARRYHHGDLPASLVSAAIDLLREGGQESLTLRAAARRAGVSAMAPYRHFVGIEALLAAVATRGFELFAERLRQADASARDAYKALIELGAAYVVFACEEPALFKLMFGAARPQGDPALAQAAKNAYGLLVRRVQSLAPEQDWPDRILASWSLVHGLAMLIVDGHVSPGGDPAALARRIGGLIARPR